MTLQLLTSLHFGIQRELLPAIEESIGPLGEKDRQFIRVCEVRRLEKLLTACDWKGIGRRPKSRLKMAHAFIAKALWNIPDTKVAHQPTQGQHHPASALRLGRRPRRRA